MSLKWREYVKRAKKRIMEALSLDEKDWQFLQENIGTACRASDEQLELVFGSECNVDKEFEKLPEDTKLDMTCQVIKATFEKLKYKKKKKKQKESEEESQEQSEEEVANEAEEQTQEQEIANE